MRQRFLPVVLVLTSSLGSVGGMTRAVLAQAATPPDAQAQGAKERARRVIENASGWTHGALDWISRKSAAMKDSAGSWCDSAESKLKAAVDDALSAPPSPTGVRLLDESGPSTEPVRWLVKGEGLGSPIDRLVLLVHGLDEPGDVWDDLAPLLRERGHRVARFDYPDDQSVRVSAEELGAALKELRASGVKRVDVVSHSLGGLVTRDVLTREAFYKGDASGEANPGLPSVGRWVMLGAPNHGSGLARLRYVAEAREHLVRWFESDGKDPRLLLGFLKDGAGEAGGDLLPGSAFLTDLNARGLPRGVRITNVVGTLANGEREKLEELLRSDWIKGVLPEKQLAQVTRAIESAENSVGDGIVTVESARLEGVDDEVRVGATHRTLLKRPMGENALREGLGEARVVPGGVSVVLDRLAH